MRPSWLGAALVAISCAVSAAAADEQHVLVLAQARDHPPGTHEYRAGAQVIAELLAALPGLRVTVADADEPFPEGPALIEQADAVVLFLGEGARWIHLDDQRMAAIERLASRGGGLVGLHWGIGARDGRYVERYLKLVGGCHGGDDRQYVFCETTVRCARPGHAVTTGIDEVFRLEDEYYYRLKFASQGRLIPLWEAEIENRWETVAWAFERPGGGRSFGFSGMHYHHNWQREECRRLILQGIAWTLGRDIPEEGLDVELAEEILTTIPPDPEGGLGFAARTAEFARGGHYHHRERGTRGDPVPRPHVQGDHGQAGHYHQAQKEETVGGGAPPGALVEPDHPGAHEPGWPGSGPQPRRPPIHRPATAW
jgi:type 1 glutamine amidotransferase